MDDWYNILETYYTLDQLFVQFVQLKDLNYTNC